MISGIPRYNIYKLCVKGPGNNYPGFRFNNIILLFALFLLPKQTFTQNNSAIDSLKKVLSKSKEDTSKVFTLLQLGEQYETNQPDSSIYYYKEAGALSQQLKHSYGRLRYIADYSYVLSIQGKFEESLALNLEGITIAEKLNDPIAIGKTLNNTANTYLYNQQNELALDYYIKARPYIENSGNAYFKSVLYSNIATIYLNLEQYELSLEYCHKGEKLARSINDTLSLGPSLLNSANAHVRLRHYDSAATYFKEARQIAQLTKEYNLLTGILLGLAALNTKTGKVLENAPLLEEVTIRARQNEDARTLGLAYEGWTAYYFTKKDNVLAAQYNDSLYHLATEKNLSDLLLKAYESKAAIQLATGNVAAFQEWSLKADSIRNNITGEKVLRKTKEMEIKYSLAKKEQELTIEQEKTRNKEIQNLILLILLATTIIIGFLIFRNLQQRKVLQQKRIVELENDRKLLAAAAILQGQEEERSRLARDLHDSLGGLLSGIKHSFSDMKDTIIMTPENLQRFEKGLALLDTSINEFRRVAHNMMPESLQKFGLDAAIRDFCAGLNNKSGLKVVYQSYEMGQLTIPNTTCITIYRVIQELLNNILKHAAASEAVVQASNENKKLLITVEDNGKGFDPAILELSEGIGWANIKNRLAYIKGKVDIQSEAGKGTSVNIEIDL